MLILISSGDHKGLLYERLRACLVRLKIQLKLKIWPLLGPTRLIKVNNNGYIFNFNLILISTTHPLSCFLLSNSSIIWMAWNCIIVINSNFNSILEQSLLHYYIYIVMIYVITKWTSSLDMKINNDLRKQCYFDILTQGAPARLVTTTL